MEKFLQDVLSGLNAKPKTLQSKYFYDEDGDILFQKIMSSSEYYLTNCEMEIFTKQTAALAKAIKNGFDSFNLVELGAGDASKSIHLIKELSQQKVNFTYMPIDISSYVIELLEETLPKKVKNLQINGLKGEYFDMLEKANQISSRRKAVLFLGANIGNMPATEAVNFCKKLRSQLNKEDLLLIGFDLKKHPKIIRQAYHDAKGYTRDFNLNLLKRINKELGANFNIDNFEHYPSYDPATGSCKSYLISLKKQSITIAKTTINFDEHEYIAMEISQKYDLKETENMAKQAGFKPIKHFYDKKNWFVDSVWECI
jgi:dimethylhistidine N-methyltransferase